MSCHEAVDDITVPWCNYIHDLYMKLGVPDSLILPCGLNGTETIWDILCDVRRAD